MIALIVTGHGNFATGICSALKLIAGDNEHILAVDFEAQHNIRNLENNLKTAFDSLKDVGSIVVFSDIAGGSPFKSASELKYKYSDKDIEVVAGANLPMLIEAFMLMNIYNDASDMAKALVETGKSQVMRLELKEHKDDVEEDGI
jgi:hypothetical protein